MNNIIPKSCSGKNKYNSKNDAFKTGRTEMKIRVNQPQLYTYICPHCKKFHLTHNSKIIDVKKYKII